MRAKVLVFGGKKSGKTQLVSKLVNPNAIFRHTYASIEIATHHSIHRGNITLDIWELPDADSLGNTFYGGSKAALLCIDLSKPLEEVKN